MDKEKLYVDIKKKFRLSVFMFTGCLTMLLLFLFVFFNFEVGDSFIDMVYSNQFFVLILVLYIFGISYFRTFRLIILGLSFAVSIINLVFLMNAVGLDVVGPLIFIYFSLPIFVISVLVQGICFINEREKPMEYKNFFVPTSVAFILSMIFLFTGISDLRIEKKIRLEKYSSIDQYDFDSIKNKCEKIVSPFHRKDCIGYTYYKRDQLQSIRNKSIERENGEGRIW
jgi:hypothetical protein